MLQTSQELANLSFQLGQKALYYELKHYIEKRETYLKDIYSGNRGIGKTFALMQLANEYNCPIIVPYERTVNYIKANNKAYYNKDIEVIALNIRLNDLRGKRYDFVLCEEGFSKEIVDSMIKPICNFVVGYKLN